MKNTYTKIEIISLLDKLKIFNKNIGEYQNFVATDNQEYFVQLSNGRIIVKEIETS